MDTAENQAGGGEEVLRGEMSRNSGQTSRMGVVHAVSLLWGQIPRRLLNNLNGIFY